MTTLRNRANSRWWPDTTSPLEAAIVYEQAGLSVIPLKWKLPAPGLGPWKPYQVKRATEEMIRGWGRKGLFHNLGIVCGAVSNNLVVLDFDSPGGYSAFTAMFPDLAETYTVATGSGEGKHVYLYADERPPSTFAMDTPLGNIELRAEGCYVVAPPSIHPLTDRLYKVENRLDILRVRDLEAVVAWITDFNRLRGQSQVERTTKREQDPVGDKVLNLRLVNAVADEFVKRGFSRNSEWLNGPCIYPERHKHGDRNPSFGFNIVSGYGYCYVCGPLLLKAICETLGIDPDDHGGLTRRPASLPPANGEVGTALRPPAPPEEPVASLSDIRLPDWLEEYIRWASRVGNQTPEIFHLGMGIWMAAVACAGRLYAEAPWGARIHPNLYMMFVADTTFYRKTTAYKLGEEILTSSIRHLLMPTPGSPERFQDALAGHLPKNLDQLPEEEQANVLEGMKFAAQRGLFKDEIAGLFGSFKRDYMVGLKDLILEIYDCPSYSSKETQSGLAVIRNAAPSILGVTTPAGLSGAISIADWDNGLLPRFALLTPEGGYKERPMLDKAERPPTAIMSGLRTLYEVLPMPLKYADSWHAPKPLKMSVESWKACQAYSNDLRMLCDPRRETPLDDRLKGVYGRLHVQAMKVAMICAALDWAESGMNGTPTVTEAHWQTGHAIAEHWRLSATRLLEQLDRSGAARQELRTQDKMLRAIREAGPDGAKLHTVYKNHNLKAQVARQIAKDLVQAGQIIETHIGRAEAYVAVEYVGP